MVSYEIRKYFEFDCAYPFDWWVTPAAALLDLIGHDFWGLFDRSTLQIVGDGRSVLNTRYGLLHHHDFARNEQGFVERITEWDLGCNRLKFAYIVDRWNALNQRVLFVRYEWDAGEGLIPQRFQPEPDDLCAALDAKFPNLDYRLLLVDVAEGGTDPRLIRSNLASFILSGEIVNSTNLQWRDNSTVWRRLFGACLWEIREWVRSGN